jgi:starch-binding outer membrane protein, SusD/RagB family
MHNSVPNTNPTEYYTVLRLAELYLIRAEAAARGAAGGINAAIADLNVIRTRALLPALPNTLTAEQVTAAVARERQVELFAEWGHRWLDLKRTGRAHDVLSALSAKQPWAGDYQLLYPIPPAEIRVNPRLMQNINYN